jgi:integrase
MFCIKAYPIELHKRVLHVTVLQWDQIDWDRSRLTVIANEEWRPKDRDSRTVPIVPELYKLLLQAFEKATPGVSNVILPDTIFVKNIIPFPFRFCAV